jgi:glycosyltransferase involved in cell wall biosynthesis
MNILQVCSKTPFPPKDGGSVAMNILTNGLIEAGNDVTVLAVNTPKHFVNEDKLDSIYKKKTKYHSVFIDTSIKPFDAFLNLFSTESYNIVRFYSKNFEAKLVELLKKNQFDVIQLETLWVAPYVDIIRNHSKAKIVLRSQNVEYAIWDRLATNTQNPLKKWYLKLLTKRLKTYEIGMLNKYDAIASITEIDAEQFKKDGCRLPIIHIPFGIDLKNYRIDRSNIEYPSVFHIGAMDWRPNAEGIKWVLENVWMNVQQKNPNLRLYLAGRNMPQWLLDYKMQNVVIVGEVADSQQFINSKSIMLVPLFSGGGMRVKIIEGMALGKTIISTAIGAEGIGYEHKEDILIANNSAEFIDAIISCSNNNMDADSLGTNARKLIERKYDNKIICEQLSDFYKELLK